MRLPILGFQYLVAAARLFLIGSVLYAGYQTNAKSDPLVTGLLVAVWGPEAGQALSSDSMSALAPGPGMCVAFMAVVQTAFILVLSDSADLAYIWCAPIVGVLLIMLLLDDLKPEPEDDGQKPLAMQTYARNRAFLLSLFILGAGVGELFLFGLSDPVLVSLCITQLSTSLLLVALLLRYGEPVHTSVWEGGSLLVLSWAYLQVCVAPLLDPAHAALRIVFAFAVVVNSALGVEVQGVPAAETRCQALARGATAVGSSLLSLVKLVLTTSLAFEWVAIIGIALLTVSLNSAWWTSKVVFPEDIQSLCRDALGIVEAVVQPVYEFTGDSDVQRVMAVAIQELAGLRSAIYRLLVPIWGSLLDGANGKVFTLFPVGSFFCMATFVAGPLLTMMGLLAKIFPEGRFFSQSQWFWAAAALGNLVFAVFTQVTPDTSIFFVYSVLDGAHYTREYTKDGVQALVAQCMILAACFILYVQTAVAAVLARSPKGTGAAFSSIVVGPPDEPPPVVEGPGVVRRCCRSVFSPLFEFLEYITSASLVLFVLSLFILVLTAVGSGSPITGISFEKRPTRQPDWLVSTTLDKVSALTVSIVRMLSPQRRLALLAVAVVQYGLEQINCWGCICVPDVVSGAESAFDAIGGIFGRRRLLELQGYSPADPVTFGPRRQLLARATCNPVSCARGLVRLCIMDVVADGLEKLTDLSIGAVDIVFNFLLEEVFSQIPVLSLAAGFLTLLPRIDIYRDLDIFQNIKFSFNVRVFGVDFGVVPSIGIPSLPSAGTLWGALPVLVVVVLAMLLARRLGVEKAAWTVVTASFQVVFISSLLAVLVGLMALTYFLINEAKIQGYDVHLKPASNLWMYAAAMALMALSLMLKIGEETERRIQISRRAGTGGRAGVMKGKRKHKWSQLED